MENHPIPQDITNFQFKLIGKMTIRQFIYLAAGAVFAWLMFFIIQPPAIVKWPISIIAISIGALFAFIPVDGRPMDTMARNFFRALMSPTQFIYQKKVTVNPQSPSLQAQTITTVQSQPAPQPKPATPPPVLQQPIAPTPQEPPPVVFPDLNDDSSTKNKLEQKQSQTGAPNILPDEKEEMKKQIDDLQKKLDEKNKKNQTSLAPAAIKTEALPDQKELEQKLADSQRQQDALQKQMLELQSKQQTSQKQKFEPMIAKPVEQTKKVRKIPTGMEASVGLTAAPDAPNLITGIVKDPRGNPIQNILVEIKDQDDNPVRAFKTNGLGKFASATSLSNGKFTLLFEDPTEKHKFDTIQMELIGSNVMPLEIISVDPREELRRELFN